MNIITIARNATMQAEESECFIIADDVHYSGYMYKYLFCHIYAIA